MGFKPASSYLKASSKSVESQLEARSQNLKACFKSASTPYKLVFDLFYTIN
jgi:hypothetical protein